MPTGYTAGIEDGTIKTFKDYALLCARAFGALIHMRDEPFDTQIYEDKSSSFYQNAVIDLKKKIEDLQNISDEELQILYDKTYEEEETLRKERLDRELQNIKKYHEIEAEVYKWVPPTEDHKGLKRFMLEQISESMKFNMVKYYSTPQERMSIADYHCKKMNELKEELKRTSKNLKEDSQRVEERNLWIRQLKESLE